MAPPPIADLERKTLEFLEAESELEHRCVLNFDTPAPNTRLSCVICTIGKTRTPELVEKMIRKGMGIACLNCIEDSHDFHKETIKVLHDAVIKNTAQCGYRVLVGIALVLRGPEIRTGYLEGGTDTEFELRKGNRFRLSIDRKMYDKGTRTGVYVDYPKIIKQVKRGNKIYMNDGAIVLRVIQVVENALICEVEIGGMMGACKSINLPRVTLDLPTYSSKDRYDIKFGVENNVDFIIAPKVRNVEAIKELREIIGEQGRDIKIIAKIENVEALHNIDAIIQEADSVFVARACLGLELPIEKVFAVQKAVIARCNRAGKPAICGTQLLDSMQYKSRPTRAEVADIGNMIMEGADGILLSNITATSPNALEAIAVIDKVCQEAESLIWTKNIFSDIISLNPESIDAVKAIAISAVDSARKSLAAAIIVLTNSGNSACVLSKYKPRCPIIAVTRCARYARQLLLYWGIVPILYTEPINNDWKLEIDARVQHALLIGRKMGIIKMGDSIVIVTQWKDGPGFTNNMRVVYAFHEQDTLECLLKKDQQLTQKIENFDQMTKKKINLKTGP